MRKQSWIPWLESLSDMSGGESVRRPRSLASCLLVGSALGLSLSDCSSLSKMARVGRKVSPCLGAVCVFRDFVGLYVRESDSRIWVLTTDGVTVGEYPARKSQLTACRWPKDQTHVLDESRRERVAEPYLSDYMRSILSIPLP